MNQWIVSFELVLWEESSEWFSKNQMSFPVLRNQERVFCVSDYCLSLLGYKAACTMCIKNCFGSILLDYTTSDWRKQLYTGKPTVENIWKRKKKGRKETEKERQRESKIAEETLVFFLSTETNDSLGHVNNLDVHTNTALCDFFPNVEENLDSHTVTI